MQEMILGLIVALLCVLVVAAGVTLAVIFAPKGKPSCNAITGARKGETERVRLMSITRDEPGLIDAWLTYHSRIFGAENIVLYDNNSSDPVVFEVYAKHPKIDLRSTPVYTQGALALAVAHEFNGLLFCLDTDEFLVTRDGDPNVGALQTEMARVMALTDQRPLMHARDFVTTRFPAPEEKLEDHAGVLIGQALCATRFTASPVMPDPPTGHTKVIVRTANVKSISDGYHLCDPGVPNPNVDFAFLHFHKRPFLEYLKHCCYDLQSSRQLPGGDVLVKADAWEIYQALVSHTFSFGAHKATALRFYMDAVMQGRAPTGADDMPDKDAYLAYYNTLDQSDDGNVSIDLLSALSS